MPNLGLIVEGVYDEAVLPIIIRKLVPDAAIETRVANGRVHHKIAGLLAGIRGNERVLVVADADMCASDLRLRQCEGKLVDACREIGCDRLKPVMLVQEMEVLLLADADAINAVCHSRGTLTGRDLPPHRGSVETMHDPKEYIEGILGSWGIRYTARVAGEIAEAVDLDMLGNWCPRSFGSLRAAATGGLR